MSSQRSLPTYPEVFIIALLGNDVQFRTTIGNWILGTKRLNTNPILAEKNSFRIINPPHFFEEDSPHPDQDMIDFMAMSYPGPNLFILAVDSEHCQEEDVVAQISKLEALFGESVTAHLVVMVPDIETFHSLRHFKGFKARLAFVNENLASECKTWCSGLHSFLYDYKNYRQEVVMRRRKALEKVTVNSSYDGPLYHNERAGLGTMTPWTPQYGLSAPAGATFQHHAGLGTMTPSAPQYGLSAPAGATFQHHAGLGTMTPSAPQYGLSAPAGARIQHYVGNGANKVTDSMVNIILLGLTGTGKSASANTILTAGNPKIDAEQLFRSEPSSMPITQQCEAKIIQKPFKRQVRLVDTPDFFNEEVKNSEAQVEACKKFFQQGPCVVLLVLQLGRITDNEKGIVEKLENKLSLRIRERTTVLLTHGEDLKGSLEKHVNPPGALKNIIEMCNNRYHVFKNSSKDTKQVIELIKKIPDFKEKKKSLYEMCQAF